MSATSFAAVADLLVGSATRQAGRLRFAATDPRLWALDGAVFDSPAAARHLAEAMLAARAAAPRGGAGAGGALLALRHQAPVRGAPPAPPVQELLQPHAVPPPHAVPLERSHALPLAPLHAASLTRPQAVPIAPPHAVPPAPVQGLPLAPLPGLPLARQHGAGR